MVKISRIVRKRTKFKTDGKKRNVVKLTAFATLYLYELNFNAGLTPVDLAAITGTSRVSLRILLRRWLSWEYVRQSEDGLYHLTSHGVVYADNHRVEAGIDPDVIKAKILDFLNTATRP